MPGIYTTFSDDQFHYRCEGCGLCCKGGFGFSAPRPQLERLIRTHPALAYFLRGDPNLLDVTNPGGCWFLEPSGLCGIEQTVGKDKKPFVCNLFPYELLGVDGARLIVSLNLLCPVSMEPGPGSIAISRAGAFHELARVDLEALVPALEPFPAGLLDLELEGELRDRCHGSSAPPDYLTLAAAQWEAYGVSSPEDAESELQAHLAEWDRLLAFPEFSAEARAEVTRVLMAVTPILRVENAQLGPRQLPLFLLATYTYGLLSATLGAAIAPKRLGQIARDMAPLLTSISLLGDRPGQPSPDLLGEAEVPGSLAPRARAIRSLLEGNARKRLTWGEIVSRSGSGPLHETLDLLSLFAHERHKLDWQG